MTEVVSIHKLDVLRLQCIWGKAERLCRPVCSYLNSCHSWIGILLPQYQLV